MSEQTQAVKPQKGVQIPQSEANDSRQVLGHMDIFAGMSQDARHALDNGPGDAMKSRGTRRQRRTNIDRMTPKARPGYVQRWVHIRHADGSDNIEVKSEAFEQGWRPRRAQTLAADEAGIPVYDPGDGKGHVLVFRSQLLLCELPIERYRQIEAEQEAEFSEIQGVIYKGTQDGGGGLGLPSELRKSASLHFEDGGRDSANLID